MPDELAYQQPQVRIRKLVQPHRGYVTFWSRSSSLLLEGHHAGHVALGRKSFPAFPRPDIFGLCLDGVGQLPGRQLQLFAQLLDLFGGHGRELTTQPVGTSNRTGSVRCELVIRAFRAERASAVGGLTLLALAACSDPLEDLARVGQSERPRVTLEPSASLHEAPRVFRARIELPSHLVPGLQVGALVLFEDELSSYYQRRVAEGELPDALLERRIPMLSWQAHGAVLFAQPSRVLDSVRTYTLAAVNHGLLAEIDVGDEDSPVLWRAWPSSDWAGGGRGGLYCAEAPMPLEPYPVLLAPDDAEAALQPSAVAPETCAVLSVPESAPLRVPPPSVLGMAFDPAPWVEPEGSTTWTASSCSVGCTTIGPGCLCAEDDRALIVGPAQPAFWFVDVNGSLQSHATDAGSGFVLTQLMPQTAYTVVGSAFDLSGHEHSIMAAFTTGSPRPRVVVNEVYADANGPEPEMEWVELANAGTSAAQLAGYVLEDVGGQTELPYAELAPGAYALVVNESYQEDTDFDLAFDPSALVIRVPRLGKNGLSNAGELVRLRSPAGEVSSRLSATPRPKPGVSVARRNWWLQDDDPATFGLHAEPGASPGLPNHLMDERE